jgi:hypothetical protein
MPPMSCSVRCESHRDRQDRSRSIFATPRTDRTDGQIGGVRSFRPVRGAGKSFANERRRKSEARAGGSGLSLRSDDHGSIVELYTEDDFRQLVVTAETMPTFLGGLCDLEDHGESSLVGDAEQWRMCSRSDLSCVGASSARHYVCFITCGLYNQSTSCRIERPHAKTARRVLVAASLVYSLLLL